MLLRNNNFIVLLFNKFRQKSLIFLRTLPIVPRKCHARATLLPMITVVHYILDQWSRRFGIFADNATELFVVCAFAYRHRNGYMYNHLCHWLKQN